MLFFKMFKKFEKVVRGGKNWEKWGKNGVKWLSENPQLYTTNVLLLMVKYEFQVLLTAKLLK